MKPKTACFALQNRLFWGSKVPISFFSSMFSGMNVAIFHLLLAFLAP
ncbi:hypothetical protein HMPREF0653_01244 [Prevotella disiens JCM 6334 = ATCC 29426]|uniref:Uncharacterized protein n=1 Tax=Prevotella disiens JCM 6334 = ATCC 29426 TaxID=1235811 RepID=A0ABP2Y840_9BACT|nr:hypothetical protein HMPREF0653_01244 [Prevotella disiens JCM 6334 = ATCC 29426]